MARTAPTATAEAPVQNGTLVCPYFHEAIELLGKRWSGAILHELLEGPKRFSALSHSIPQISDRLLSTRLKELEACGLVEREVYEDSPVRVDYALTPKGRALEPSLKAIGAWAREWL